jgi:uncharacterized protein
VIKRVVVGVILVAVALAPAVAQIEIPANQGWVTDLAGMLTPQQERELETLMQSYKDGSGNEIALLTVPNLGGNSLERYAIEVGRGWGMGEKEKNNAALLLIARDERKIRIEVARGLEGTLTDSISGRIIRNVITPRFKQGRMYEGMLDGIVAMHAAAGGDYASIPRERGRRSKGGGIAGLIPLIFIVILLLNLGRHAGARGCLPWLFLGAIGTSGRRSSGWHAGGGGGGFSGGGFGGFGGGGGFSGGGASGGW